MSDFLMQRASWALLQISLLYQRGRGLEILAEAWGHSPASQQGSGLSYQQDWYLVAGLYRSMPSSHLRLAYSGCLSSWIRTGLGMFWEDHLGKEGVELEIRVKSIRMNLRRRRDMAEGLLSSKLPGAAETCACWTAPGSCSGGLGSWACLFSKVRLSGCLHHCSRALRERVPRPPSLDERPSSGQGCRELQYIFG